MKVSQRLDIIKQIADELGKRYDEAQARTFLHAFADYVPQEGDYESFNDLVTYTLSNVSESILGEIVDDLGMVSLATVSAKIQLPAIWTETKKFRVFISHLSTEKQKAARLRKALEEYGCNAFVAHDDIEPTHEWQVQIERALHSMDLFISMHTKGFSVSVWTQQEVGFAVAKGTKIITLRMGEDPVGFISKHQALSRGSLTAEEIAKKIDSLLLKDERTKERYLKSKDMYEFDLDDDVPF